jgi:hypothetical protein
MQERANRKNSIMITNEQLIKMREHYAHDDYADVNRLISAYVSERKARVAAWQPIETAPKDIVWSDGRHRHGKRIVAYDSTSGRIITCHWWETDIGGGGSNFLDDGGNAVFPSRWIDLEPPEEDDE